MKFPAPTPSCLARRRRAGGAVDGPGAAPMRPASTSTTHAPTLPERPID